MFPSFSYKNIVWNPHVVHNKISFSNTRHIYYGKWIDVVFLCKEKIKGWMENQYIKFDHPFYAISLKFIRPENILMFKVVRLLCSFLLGIFCSPFSMYLQLDNVWILGKKLILFFAWKFSMLMSDLCQTFLICPLPKLEETFRVQIILLFWSA